MSDTTPAYAGLQVAQLASMAELHPEAIGYRVVGVGHLTFADWDRQANRLARGLTSAGVGHGDRVAIWLGGANALRWVTAYAAVHRAGGAVVPLDPRLAPTEVAGMLAHAGAVAVVTDEQRVGAALSMVGDGSLSVVIDAGADRADAGGRAWSDLLDADGSAYQVPVSQEDLSEILFTSGTTGHPKGVAIRHVNASAVPNGRPNWSGGLWLHASPLATFAGISFIYSPMKLGMTSVYQPAFDASEWIDFVEAEAPVAVFLVPAMVQLLLAHPRFDQADLSSIGMCAVGSAPLAPTAIDRLQERMPDALVSNNYGMTEAGSVYCLMPKGEAVRRPGSVGKPLPPAEVVCVDADGTEVPAGEYGEVRLRIPGRQREYFGDPGATAETWVDGWLRTGDIGRLDEDGYLYIGGRVKDVIIRGGSNVYAVDVENVLLTHPGVAEVAVIGVPHDVLGEDVAAVVVPAPGWEADPDALRAHGLETLAAYKVPRRWEFVDQLPRNPTGKVLKHQLREQFATEG
ncbi:MAG TPA: AMP-binding protein [Acidimicrobiales bacterium]|jgi:acyl-CoA synthetase (AMP-forming)/AMP-acid ligase II|nr:AMP-binding protein [Acidimicrobiales bacterium]